MSVDITESLRRASRAVNLARIDRLPPHSIESEQGALGCCLLDPPQCVPQCASAVSAASFYDLRHQTLFTALCDMQDNQRPIDLVTLGQALRDQGSLEAIGGYAYLSQLQDATPTAANLSYYLGILRDKYALRKLIAVCTDVCARAYETVDTDAAALVADAERQILEMSVQRSETRIQTSRELMRAAIDQIEDWHSGQGKMQGTPTGFVDFDKLTGGMSDGDLIVIAARPSMGKTALAMNIVEHVAANCGICVGVFSLEMAAKSIGIRMLCSSARINSRSVGQGVLSEGDFRNVTTAAAKIGKSKFVVDDTPDLPINQLRSRARRMVREHGCKMFVVDYLQLIQPSTTKRYHSREAEVSDVSRNLKAMAKELNVPVIALCQLNRDLEKEKNRKPRLSDLRESGGIEQDGDVIGMLYKPSTDDDEGEDRNACSVNLLIAKQRNGEAGVDVPLTFLKSFTRFESQCKFEPQ